MSAVTAPAPAASVLRAYWLEAKLECLRTLRMPSFVLPALLFPVVFYALFGIVLGGGRGGGDAARVMLAGYGVFGVIGAALFGFGVGVAVERDRGWLTLKRAQPMPPGAYLAGKLVMAMGFAAVIALMLGVVAHVFGGVRLSPGTWALLWIVDVLGVLPFCALGLWMGTLVGGNAAPAVVNLVYLPMAFLSGLWIPLNVLPELLQRLAPLWPAYHLGQVALKVVDRDAGRPLALHLGVLAAVGIICFVLARRRLARTG